MVKNGLSTKLALVISILLIIPPALKEVIAQIENADPNFTQGNEVMLIAGAAVAGVIIIMRCIQAAIVLIKGGEA